MNEAGRLTRILDAQPGQPCQWRGALCRPWLDMPEGWSSELHVRYAADWDVASPWDETARSLLAMPDPWSVLADYWLDQSDPRGEFLVRLGRPQDAENTRRLIELWTTHHTAWLGFNSRYVPRSGIQLEPRFYRSLSMYILRGEEHQVQLDDPIFQLVKTLRFLPGGVRVIGPGMHRVTSLGPLDEDAFADLDSQPVPFDTEVLHLHLSELDVLALATWRTVPQLSHLQISFARWFEDAAALRELGHVPPTCLVEVAFPETRYNEIAEWFTHWRSHRPGQPFRLTDFDDESERFWGWSATLVSEDEVVLERQSPAPVFYALELAERLRPQFRVAVRLLPAEVESPSGREMTARGITVMV
ncbi:MAG: hypothetical protein AAGA48_22400 [Myxococcota bacterium]